MPHALIRVRRNEQNLRPQQLGRACALSILLFCSIVFWKIGGRVILLGVKTRLTSPNPLAHPICWCRTIPDLKFVGCHGSKSTVFGSGIIRWTCHSTTRTLFHYWWTARQTARSHRTRCLRQCVDTTLMFWMSMSNVMVSSVLSIDSCQAAQRFGLFLSSCHCLATVASCWVRRLHLFQALLRKYIISGRFLTTLILGPESIRFRDWYRVSVVRGLEH